MYFSLYLAALILGCSNARAELETFCERLPRSAYKNFEKSSVSTEWFEVYEVEPDVWAIYEPFQWQEVISYLIIGSDSALLFDTGNGIGDIRAIVDQLADNASADDPRTGRGCDRPHPRCAEYWAGAGKMSV
jgi:hypothetical protein